MLICPLVFCLPSLALCAASHTILPEKHKYMYILEKKFILAENITLPQDIIILRDKWLRLQKTHDNTVFDPQNIPLPLSHKQQYKALNDLLPSMDPMTRLRSINGFFNKIPSRDDAYIYGVNEYWATPKEFLENRGGDCEDYAFAKYFALKYFQWPKKHLWVVLLFDNINDGMHAVLAAKYKKNIFILDNLSKPAYLLIPEKQYAKQIRPFAVLNAQGLWLPVDK